VLKLKLEGRELPTDHSYTNEVFMFGLENKKDGEDSKEFVFDLESDLKNPKKSKDFKKQVEGKIQQIKQVLRGGCVKDDFDQFGILLHGYTSLLKVLSRFKA